MIAPFLKRGIMVRLVQATFADQTSGYMAKCYLQEMCLSKICGWAHGVKLGHRAMKRFGSDTNITESGSSIKCRYKLRDESSPSSA